MWCYGIIKQCCDNRRYLIRLPNGMISERNKRFLRFFHKPVILPENVVYQNSEPVNIDCSVKPDVSSCGDVVTDQISPNANVAPYDNSHECR